jgi:hypothetical protein
MGSTAQDGREPAAHAEAWTVRHFSLADPAGPERADIPAFLRRLADEVQRRGPVQVQDIVFHLEIDEDGVEYPTATVYFHEASRG